MYFGLNLNPQSLVFNRNLLPMMISHLDTFLWLKISTWNTGNWLLKLWVSNTQYWQPNPCRLPYHPKVESLVLIATTIPTLAIGPIFFGFASCCFFLSWFSKDILTQLHRQWKSLLNVMHAHLNTIAKYSWH